MIDFILYANRAGEEDKYNLVFSFGSEEYMGFNSIHHDRVIDEAERIADALESKVILRMQDFEDTIFVPRRVGKRYAVEIRGPHMELLHNFDVDKDFTAEDAYRALSNWAKREGFQPSQGMVTWRVYGDET